MDESIVWTVEDVAELMDCLDSLLLLSQCLLFVLFIIVGGLCAVSFFIFWKGIFYGS